MLSRNAAVHVSGCRADATQPSPPTVRKIITGHGFTAQIYNFVDLPLLFVALAAAANAVARKTVARLEIEQPTSRLRASAEGRTCRFSR